MALWAFTDANANSAPKHKNFVAGSGKVAANAYANTKASASFQGTNNLAVGVFGIDVTETGLSKKVTHAGWNIVRQGTGAVTGLSITVAGTGYSNTNLVKVL
jgi:hypothetical protein